MACFHTISFRCLITGIVTMIMMTVSSVVADKDNINNIHEKMILRNSFYKKNRSNPQTIHEIVISIQQNNIQQLQNTLLEISTPGNAKYQQWLNSNEVGELVRNEVATNNVKQWIHRIGAEIISESLHGEYLRVTAPISIWERELQTEFYEWEDHQKRNKHKEGWNVEYDSINKQFSTYHRSEDYTIPTDLREHITAIFKTCQAPPVITHHSQMKRDNSDSSESTQKSKDLSSKHDIHPFKSTMYVRQQTTQDKSNGSTDTDTDADSSFIHLFNHFLPKNQPKKSPIHTQSAPTDVTVPFLNSFYKVASNVGSPLINQSVFETDNQYYSTQDLASFQSTYGIPNEIPIAINGNSIKSCPQVSQCAEGNLDIQYLMGIAQLTTTIYWYTGGDDAFVDWITDVASVPNPPLTNSISWGSVEQSLSYQMMVNFETEASKLCAQGVTIVVSSGDDGAVNIGCSSCNPNQAPSQDNCACQANSGSSIPWSGPKWTGTGYFPSFPATVPYVTAVGATMGNGQPSIVPFINGQEIACQSQEGGVITSGGGFSTVFARPGYQSYSIPTYFKRLSTQPVAGYNPNGRGYPDVALLGISYVTIVAGAMQRLYGTSCAAPVFAGLVSLVNAARLEQNLTSVGFLNPTLYANGNKSGVFNDITSGSNNCCTYTGGTPSSAPCCNSGFSATAGWDPVTGLGSIYYPNLAGLFSVNASFVQSEPTVEPKPFWGIPASVMAVIIIVIVLLAISYPIGAFLRRKYLPKSAPPRDVHEDHRDCRALYRCGCGIFCPCYQIEEPEPTPARRNRRRSSLQAPLITDER